MREHPTRQLWTGSEMIGVGEPALGPIQYRRQVRSDDGHWTATSTTNAPTARAITQRLDWQ